MGRHSEYTEAMGDKICEAVSSHTVGIKHLHKMYDWFPDDSAVYNWRNKYPDFDSKYKRAKCKQAELMVEELEDVAGSAGKYLDSDGNERVDGGSVSQKRLICDNRKWMASKLAPKLYGDQKQIDDLKSQNDKMQAEVMVLRAQLDAQNKKDY